ncbi:MAG: PQQ-dependent sugar dehydrogenase [Actinobacteria bacterium]|nr:PQQ-dependent sugar dehydrogenase [Actinomycetota bacterium]
MSLRWLGHAAAAALVAIPAAAAGGIAALHEGTPVPTRARAPLGLDLVASGFVAPVDVVTAPGERDRLYVVEQEGRVRVVAGARTLRTPFLDLHEETTFRSEQGLLGLAFHPDYERNRRVYAHFTDSRGDTRVVEFRASDGRVLPSTRREVLRVDQPYENHNGGQIRFGPEGKLYVALGDGGSAYDPERRAQDPRSRLGKLLRADVDRPHPRWEVAGYGLRNPWKFAFDRASGSLFIADVGQDRWEEVNVVPGGLHAPINFGWDVYEGHERVAHGPLTGGAEVVWPAAVYPHDPRCSVTGGVVYRGAHIRALVGRFLYGDYCTGEIWSLRVDPDGRAAVRVETPRLPSLTAFGEDAAGEVLVVSLTGDVYRIVARPRR